MPVCAVCKANKNDGYSMLCLKAAEERHAGPAKQEVCSE
jgi:hypothetical protein